MIENWRLVKVAWYEVWHKEYWETERKTRVGQGYVWTRNLNFIEPLKNFKWRSRDLCIL